MPELPSNPDLDQLRRQAKEFRRASSGALTLAAAQRAVAGQYGYASWPALKAAVDAAGGVRPLWPNKHAHTAVSDAGQSMAWARTQGWDPGPRPAGVVFTSARFLTDHLAGDIGRYRESTSLTPVNGRVFLTTTGPPVAVACLGVGAPAVVTVVEQLVALDVDAFVAVGPAPAVSDRLEPGSCVVIDRALRDDGVSQHYLAPARYATADVPLSARLGAAAAAAGLAPVIGSSWTVPTPYRTTAAELAGYRAEGVLVTELVTAALFAAAGALGARAAAAVVVSRRRLAPGDSAPSPRRGPGVLALLDAAVETLQAVGR